jgi:hypothetical protein
MSDKTFLAVLIVLTALYPVGLVLVFLYEKGKP